MKKFLLLPVVLAAGFGILILISSGSSDNTGKEAQGDVFPTEERDYVTTESGLKYEDVKVGDGKEARTGSQVVVHYTGWLKNGTKFDSSRDRSEPFSFKLGTGQVIKGFDMGVTGMKVGQRRKVTIPSLTVFSSPSGAPIATTLSPTFGSSMISVCSAGSVLPDNCRAATSWSIW